METTVQPNAQTRASRLDGSRVAAEIKREVTEDAGRLRREHNVTPRLVTVLVGDDPASAVYVRNKVRTCEELGLASEHHHLPSDTPAERLLKMVAGFNAREDVDGLLVQLPLPKQMDEAAVIEAIDPAKDVDGFHPVT